MGGDVKITGVQFHKVNIPLEAPMLWAGGINRSWTRIVIRMQTDEGIEGIGETCGGDSTLLMLQQLKEFYISQDPFDTAKILKHFWYVPRYHGNTGKYAMQGLETCCYDIMGKAANRPISQLLGGKMRDVIPTIAYVFYRLPGAGGVGGERTAQEIVDYTRALCERTGLTTIKMKGGVHDPEEEFRTTAALREAFPDHKLRFDPNNLWSVETAIRMGRKFESLDLEFYEDPVWGIEGMSRARRDVRIPFATNMCSVQLDELPVAIREHAIDVQLLDVQDWGGITNVWRAAATCQTFQIGIGFHSGGEAGISTALYLQLAAALPVLPYAIDSHYHHQTDDVLTEMLPYENGCFRVPDGPGLGVEIDEDKLRHLERLNEDEGDLVFYGDFNLAGAVGRRPTVSPPEPRYMGMY